jgi:hypothetical protein
MNDDRGLGALAASVMQAYEDGKESQAATIATLRAELATAQEVRTTASDREADAVHLIDDIRRLIAEYDRG